MGGDKMNSYQNKGMHLYHTCCHSTRIFLQRILLKRSCIPYRKLHNFYIFNKFKLNRFSNSNHLDESVLKFRGCLRIFIIHLNSKRSRTLFKIGAKTLIRGCGECTTSDLGLHCLSTLCPLKRSLIILCNITFYVNTFFYL